jgi:MurNAc alpha-1-phosphate uridylyltransferase
MGVHSGGGQAVLKTAMVLSAGLGTRMAPANGKVPKPLVRLHDKPLIDHVLDRLAVAGVARAVVNVHHMADQIEQRIFPKLRGVEPDLAQNALQAIGGVIGQLGDAALETAFREGWQNQPTFLFRGVVRDS